MIQFVFDHDIQMMGKAEMKIVCQVGGVAAPGKRDDLDAVPAVPKVFYKFAIVQVSPAHSPERTIDNEANPHDRSISKDAQAASFSHSTTRSIVMFFAWIRSLKATARIRAKCSRLGFRPVNSGRSLRILFR